VTEMLARDPQGLDKLGVDALGEQQRSGAGASKTMEPDQRIDRRLIPLTSGNQSSRKLARRRLRTPRAA
jgi:hypothetical protein